MHPAHPPTARLDRARIASRCGFGALGVMSGVWGVHIPSLKLHWGWTETQLSGLLFIVAVGALAALGLAGSLVHRFGARGVTPWAALSAATALTVIFTGGPWPVLALALACYGASMGVYDVAVNTAAMALEAETGRPILGQLHGLFSVGAMVGAAAAAALLPWSAPEAVQIGVLTLPATLLVWWATRRTDLEFRPSQPAASGRFVWPHGRLLQVGWLVMASFMAEGVMCDWIVLYLRQELAPSQASAGLGYAVFAGAMATARFGSDALRLRCGELRLLRWSGALCACAMALVWWPPAQAPLAVALIGIALVGIGLAPSVPILLKAATRVPGVTPSAAIASASSVGYLGFLIGPALIGALTRAVSLPAALGVVCLAGLLLAFARLQWASSASTSE